MRFLGAGRVCRDDGNRGHWLLLFAVLLSSRRGKFAEAQGDIENGEYSGELLLSGKKSSDSNLVNNATSYVPDFLPRVMGTGFTTTSPTRKQASHLPKSRGDTPYLYLQTQLEDSPVPARPSEPPPSFYGNFSAPAIRRSSVVPPWMWAGASVCCGLLIGCWLLHQVWLCQVSSYIRRIEGSCFTTDASIAYAKIYTFFTITGIVGWISLCAPNLGLLLGILKHFYEVCCLHWFWMLMLQLLGGPDEALVRILHRHQGSDFTQSVHSVVLRGEHVEPNSRATGVNSDSLVVAKGGPPLGETNYVYRCERCERMPTEDGNGMKMNYAALGLLQSTRGVTSRSRSYIRLRKVQHKKLYGKHQKNFRGKRTRPCWSLKRYSLVVHRRQNLFLRKWPAFSATIFCTKDDEQESVGSPFVAVYEDYSVAKSRFTSTHKVLLQTQLRNLTHKVALKKQGEHKVSRGKRSKIPQLLTISPRRRSPTQSDCQPTPNSPFSQLERCHLSSSRRLNDHATRGNSINDDEACADGGMKKTSYTIGGTRVSSVRQSKVAGWRWTCPIRLGTPDQLHAGVSSRPNNETDGVPRIDDGKLRRIWCVPPLCCLAACTKKRQIQRCDIRLSYFCLLPYTVLKTSLTLISTLLPPTLGLGWQTESHATVSGRSQVEAQTNAFNGSKSVGSSATAGHLLQFILQQLSMICLMIAMWGIAVVFRATRPHLKGYKIGLKFTCIKVLVFSTQLLEIIAESSLPDDAESAASRVDLFIFIQIVLSTFLAVIAVRIFNPRETIAHRLQK